MKWIKKGLIFKPDKRFFWSKTHSMIPTPIKINERELKVFYSGRDKENRSHIGYVVFDLKNNLKIIKKSSKPILSPGNLGCFDDNGVTPSCAIKIGKKIFLYYIGWNPGSTVRMHLFGGLAISSDNGESFSRWSRAPIIERNITDPFLNTAPFVVKVKGGYRMYYVSGHEWLHKDLPRYNIKTAFSKDGLAWQRKGKVCIDFKDSSENALARPFVIFDKGVWKMWFGYKKHFYRIGYAESHNGIDWKRKDHLANIDVSKDGFDSEMLEYASVIRYKSGYAMFYNGNNYGFDGIGLAISE